MKQNEEQGYKFLKITDETHKKLSEYGKKSETYDEIIQRLFAELNQK